MRSWKFSIGLYFYFALGSLFLGGMLLVPLLRDLEDWSDRLEWVGNQGPSLDENIVPFLAAMLTVVLALYAVRWAALRAENVSQSSGELSWAGLIALSVAAASTGSVGTLAVSVVNGQGAEAGTLLLSVLLLLVLVGLALRLGSFIGPTPSVRLKQVRAETDWVESELERMREMSPDRALPIAAAHVLMLAPLSIAWLWVAGSPLDVAAQLGSLWSLWIATFATVIVSGRVLARLAQEVVERVALWLATGLTAVGFLVASWAIASALINTGPGVFDTQGLAGLGVIGLLVAVSAASPLPSGGMSWSRISLSVVVVVRVRSRLRQRAARLSRERAELLSAVRGSRTGPVFVEARRKQRGR